MPISLNSHPDVPWLLDDVLAEQPQLTKQQEKTSLYLDDQLWTVVDGRADCETQLYVHEKNWELLISLVHEKIWHPGLQASWAFWRRRYVTRDLSRTNGKTKALLEGCAPCIWASLIPVLIAGTPQVCLCHWSHKLKWQWT